MLKSVCHIVQSVERELQKMSVDEIVDNIAEHFENERVFILSPIARDKKGTLG